MLEALDVFSFLSNHSYLISIKIIESNDIAELAQAAQHINRLIALLHQSGTKVSLIAMLVQELNARLFERAWQLIAPPDLVANGCLFVMGSEGRGEQLLKTDQDNGLILRDGYVPPGESRRNLRPVLRRACAISATPTVPATSWSATRSGGSRPAISAA